MKVSARSQPSGWFGPNRGGAGEDLTLPAPHPSRSRAGMVRNVPNLDKRKPSDKRRGRNSRCAGLPAAESGGRYQRFQRRREYPHTADTSHR
jgi:hypothetical protein